MRLKKSSIEAFFSPSVTIQVEWVGKIIKRDQSFENLTKNLGFLIGKPAVKETTQAKVEISKNFIRSRSDLPISVIEDQIEYVRIL